MLPAFPSPDASDAEDVAWGLTTGAALWKQGEKYDAIVWLKRAVDAATEAGLAVRADELNRAATELLASLSAPADPTPSGGPPPPPMLRAPNVPSSPVPHVRTSAPAPPPARLPPPKPPPVRGRTGGPPPPPPARGPAPGRREISHFPPLPPGR